MKKIMIVILLLLTACGPVPSPEQEIPEGKAVTYSISRVEDKEAGVVCWVFSEGYRGGISCLPITETLLVK